MRKQIEIIVKDKIASLVDKEQFIVCGNTDYDVYFSFSEEWQNETVKTALFVFNDKVIEKPFRRDVCEGVEIEDATLCGIGVYTSNIITTTPAYVNCYKSVRDMAQGKMHSQPTEDVYNQIVKLTNDFIQEVENRIEGLASEEYVDNAVSKATYDHIITNETELFNIENLEGKILISGVNLSKVPPGGILTLNNNATLLDFEELTGDVEITFKGNKNCTVRNFKIPINYNNITFDGFDIVDNCDTSGFENGKIVNCNRVENCSAAYISNCRFVSNCTMYTDYDSVIDNCKFVCGISQEDGGLNVDNFVTCRKCEFVANIDANGSYIDCKYVDVDSCKGFVPSADVGKVQVLTGDGTFVASDFSTPSQVDEKISQVQADIAVSYADKPYVDGKIGEIEYVLEQFGVVSSQEYAETTTRVPIPVRSNKYAYLKSLGGMTYKSKNLVHIPDIQKGIGDNNIIYVNLTDTIYVSAEEIATVSSNIWRLEITQLNGEKRYVMDDQLQSGGVSFNKITADNPVISIKYRDTYITEGKYSKFMITYGMTRVSYEPYGEMRDAKVTAIRNHGANLTDEMTIDPSVIINKEVYRELPLILGQGTYTISFSISAYWQSHSTNITRVTGTTISNAFVFTVNDNAPAFVRFRDATSSSTPWDYSTKIMVNRGDNALPYSPYCEKTIQLPNEIVSLDGWGKGIEGYSNTYDFENSTYTKYTNDGETLLESPTTQLVPTSFNPLIRVERGGSLELVNAAEKAVPVSVEFQIINQGEIK